VLGVREEIERLVVLISGGGRTGERRETACAGRRWWRRLLGERWREDARGRKRGVVVMGSAEGCIYLDTTLANLPIVRR
jgi:hypothetical protein